jgi:hypothetical protein
MEIGGVPQTVSAERLRGGVLITFSDGEEGFYPDEVLYSFVPTAKELLAAALEDVDGAGEAPNLPFTSE